MGDEAAERERRSSCCFVTPAGRVGVELEEGVVVRLHLGTRQPPSPELPAAVEGLAAYLRGERSPLPPVPWRLRGGTPFQRAVWQALTRIPAGTTWTYGDLATHLGRPGAARAVGQALGRNPLPVLLPCHRVVATRGPGGFSSGLAWKRYLLALEGGEAGHGPPRPSPGPYFSAVSLL